MCNEPDFDSMSRDELVRWLEDVRGFQCFDDESEFYLRQVAKEDWTEAA